MVEQRWLRIIPVALIMYTISYVDRTNIALALDPKISTMMRDLALDDAMKSTVAGIFFWGYLALQIPAGHLANRWSAKKVIAILLVFWGVCAAGCGLVKTYHQLVLMRVLLGVAESGVFPATLVLLANWFPRSERARANAYWNLCQPLAVAGSAPVTGLLIGAWGWKTMLILEGALPFCWLPIWLYFINDHPREAEWISKEEKNYLEGVLQHEAAELEPSTSTSMWQAFVQPAVFVMIPIYFLQNCAAYGCNTFLTEGIHSTGHDFTPFQTSVLFAVPYALAAVVMVVNSWHSDKTHERRGHVAIVYTMSGISLIASVLLKEHSFWLSYAFLCFAVPGPFAGLAPFWAIPAETLPRGVLGAVMGLVNAFGNIGGYFGNKTVGYLKTQTHGITVPFTVLGLALIVAAALCFLLPRAKPGEQTR
jgi:MFS family permease